MSDQYHQNGQDVSSRHQVTIQTTGVTRPSAGQKRADSMYEPHRQHFEQERHSDGEERRKVDARGKDYASKSKNEANSYRSKISAEDAPRRSK